MIMGTKDSPNVAMNDIPLTMNGAAPPRCNVMLASRPLKPRSDSNRKLFMLVLPRFNLRATRPPAWNSFYRR